MAAALLRISILKAYRCGECALVTIGCSSYFSGTTTSTFEGPEVLFPKLLVVQREGHELCGRDASRCP